MLEALFSKCWLGSGHKYNTTYPAWEYLRSVVLVLTMVSSSLNMLEHHQDIRKSVLRECDVLLVGSMDKQATKKLQQPADKDASIPTSLGFCIEAVCVDVALLSQCL